MTLVNNFEYSTGSFIPKQAAHELDKGDLKVIEDFHKLYFKLLEKKSGLQLFMARSPDWEGSGRSLALPRIVNTT